MRGMLLFSVSLAAVAVWTSDARAGDCEGCAAIKKAGFGFCEHCGSGKIYGIQLSSHKLYDALAGDAKELDGLKKSPCPGCRTAAEKSGECTHCGVFVAGGHVFHSPTVYALARGTPVNLEEMKCPGCVKAAKEDGSCDHCKTQFVAGRMYESTSFYEAAKKALETVKLAVKDCAKCEGCALARVADGTCEKCKVNFKDGKPVS